MSELLVVLENHDQRKWYYLSASSTHGCVPAFISTRYPVIIHPPSYGGDDQVITMLVPLFDTPIAPEGGSGIPETN